MKPGSNGNVIDRQTFRNLFVRVFAPLLFLCACFVAQIAEADTTLAVASYPPKGFVFARDMMPDIALEIRYYGEDNFIGTRVDGYNAPQAIMSVEAAAALRAVSMDLRKKGYALKIFDAYRPEWAVRHFVRWAKDLSDTRNKARFYPGVDKAKLFELGYIAGKSGHSRGSTVDLTLIDLKSGEELDMGSPFDFFGEISHHDTALVTPRQTANRAILRDAMEARGFKRLKEEWWHYFLKNEPYPDTFFDFSVSEPQAAPSATQRILNERVGTAGRVVVVEALAAGGNKAVLRAYARTDGVWTLRFTTNGWLGKGGFTTDKREGDGATPTGIFNFGRAFGIADDPGATKPYTKVSKNDVWVDDPASKYYNQWARADFPDADWKSAERLADYTNAYEYAISIDYNVNPIVPGKGSAIFLHVAGTGPTAGCVAVPKAAMVYFLGFIEGDTKIALLPSPGDLLHE
ncbi:MAG: L,D-transpeptidase family protein [Azoarcus sp.]|nr:L,D-transpeptidase family protein [Azoarcus sp.]